MKCIIIIFFLSSPLFYLSQFCYLVISLLF
jgi:hypothetical protein